MTLFGTRRKRLVSTSLRSDRHHEIQHPCFPQHYEIGFTQQISMRTKQRKTRFPIFSVINLNYHKIWGKCPPQSGTTSGQSVRAGGHRNLRQSFHSISPNQVIIFAEAVKFTLVHEVRVPKLYCVCKKSAYVHSAKIGVYCSTLALYGRTFSKMRVGIDPVFCCKTSTCTLKQVNSWGK